MTILVITNTPLLTLTNGYDSRVLGLCRALSAHEKLVLLVLKVSPRLTLGEAQTGEDLIFSDTFASISLADARSFPWRHFRLSEDRFFSWGYPSFQSSVEDQINHICNAQDIHKIIVFGSNLVGLTRQLRPARRMLLDVCDSVSLTVEREISIADKRKITLDRLKKWLSLMRWRQLEGKSPQWFDHVVTINQNDTDKIRKLSGGRQNLSTIPNGVDPMFEHAYQEGPCMRRGVAFWGNLSFSPNQVAVQYFYREVYVPYLKPAGIEWCVIGRDPDPVLIEAAAKDSNLRLLGFVDDLRESAIDYPIMVNPMLSGSGLKNKVLEASAMGLAVVSTALGMESIDGAIAGETYMLADSPEQFFGAVLALLESERKRVEIIRAARRLMLSKYTWEIVGTQWVRLVDSVFSFDAAKYIKSGE